MTVKEGSLGAPIRHPLDWENPNFTDEKLLDKELRRVFDICHGCRRCFNLCESFPKLFDYIDDSKSGELDTVSSDKFKDVVDACTLCDMCFLTKCPYVPPHEFNIDFPHLMLRYRVAERNKGKNKLIDDQLTKTDRNGKFFSKFSNLANWSTKTSNKMTRPIMEMLLKIDKEAELPKFYKDTLINQVDTKKIETKKLIKKDEKNSEIKSENLRISKGNEVKPEIKKVKKQETEKREYKIKDYVVYPKHGVGQITEFKKINIGGIDVETYVIKFEKDKANGMVPVNKQSHLRALATINQVNKCVSILKSKPKIKRSMWSRRAQEYESKISSGKIYELAEVVRDLNKGDDLMVDQSYSERQLFEKAYERILSEFKIILNISLEDTQKKLDKALKRNLENQTKPSSSINKDSSSELPVEDPISENEESLSE